MYPLLKLSTMQENSSNAISSLKGRQTNSNSYIPSKTKDPVYKNKKLIIGLAVLILILGAVLSYSLFFSTSKFSSPTADKLGEVVDNIKENLGDTYENPINGVKISMEEASKFKDKKPIAVMINNYVDARPSFGLSQADIVYEAVAEGGITRLMPVFFSNLPDKAESVRSARYYFAELASSYKAHYIHWGLAHRPDCQMLSIKDPKYCGVETDPRADAKDVIAQLGLANLDGGMYACDVDKPDCVFSRDPSRIGKVAIEHTAFVRPALVYDLAKKIRPQESWHQFIEFKKWTFKDDLPENQRGDVGINPVITYNYWDSMPGFNVKWEYDKKNNEYLRYQGDVKQIDAGNQKEIRAKVVIIRFTKQEPANDKKHHQITYVTGKGAALIFQDGKVIKGFWSRNGEEDMDLYTDEDGKEVQFNRGQAWVQLVPQGNNVKYGGELINNTVKGASTSSPENTIKSSTQPTKSSKP